MFYPPLDELVHIVLDSIQGMYAFRKVPRTKISKFALDVVFIALGIRTGYLFDAFALSDKTSRTPPLETFESLMQSLREKMAMFGDVVVLTDTFRADFIFLNVPLFIKRVEADDLPTFVSLKDATPMVLSSVPSHVTSRMHGLSSDLTKRLSEHQSYPLSMTVPWDTTNPAEAVPLVGILLDYPVTYKPGDGDTGPFLSNVELEVFTYVLSKTEINPADDAATTLGREHQLLQFSCPRNLLDEAGDFNGRLRLRLERRIADLQVPYELAVRNRTERLDRVAL